MTVVPVEVVRIGDVTAEDVGSALALANSAQKELLFVELASDQAADLRMHSYISTPAAELLDTMESFRGAIRGYHPFLIAFVDARLRGPQYDNLFGSHRAEKGVAVATIADVPDTIIPKNRMRRTSFTILLDMRSVS